MKTHITYSLLAAAASCGMAFGAATAYTTPVGYEQLSLSLGFNYTGLRLQSPALAAGNLEAVTTTSVTDSGLNIQALVSPGKTYILEVNTVGQTGAVAEVLGSSIATGTITTTPTNLVAAGAAVGDTYILRESSTIASIFGATNSAGLTPGFGSSVGADVVYVPTGTGSFTSYYYDGDDTIWKNAQSGANIVAADVPLVYLDAVLIFAANPVNLTVSGEVVKKPVIQAVASGFNYIGSVYPAGATLASAYGGAIGTFNQGFGSSVGADVVYVPNGSGGFNSYYYDGDDTVWKNALTSATIDPATISLPSGLLFFNGGAARNLKNSPPTSYSSL